jgi:SAM-dependent methyltransferase
VLDIGTGTGIWAMFVPRGFAYRHIFDSTPSPSDFADRNPSARVTGTDLSPIQPYLVPPNVKFEVDDCCDEWTFSANSFDFIHVRGLYGCVADWEVFYKKVLR